MWTEQGQRLARMAGFAETFRYSKAVNATVRGNGVRDKLPLEHGSCGRVCTSDAR